MANQLQSLKQKWIVLSKRDRVLLFMVSLFANIGLIDTYLTNPIRQQKAVAEQEIVKLAEDTAKVEQQMRKLNTTDPSANTVLQQQIAHTKAQIAQQESKLKNLGNMMVPPQEINALMRQLLQQHPQVRVVDMESLPPVSFLKKLTGDKTTEVLPQNSPIDLGTMYQHSVRIKLQGDYAALTRYAADLKALGTKASWEMAEFKSNYPEAEMTIEVYTLSPNKAWLGI